MALYTRSTPLGLAHILPRPRQGKDTRSWVGGASAAQRLSLREAEKVVLLIFHRRKCQTGSQESDGMVSALEPPNSVTDTPRVCPDPYTLANAADSSAGH